MCRSLDCLAGNVEDGVGQCCPDAIRSRRGCKIGLGCPFERRGIVREGEGHRFQEVQA